MIQQQANLPQMILHSQVLYMSVAHVWKSSFLKNYVICSFSSRQQKGLLLMEEVFCGFYCGEGGKNTHANYGVSQEH